MKIEFSTINEDGKPLSDESRVDELTVFLDLATAKANAKNLLTAVEVTEEKADQEDRWIAFVIKGEIRIDI